MKKLEDPDLKAKERKWNNDCLKWAIKNYKDTLEQWQKDHFKKEEEKKDGEAQAEEEKKEEEKEEVIKYETEQEKTNPIDVDHYKKLQEEFYKKNKENIEKVEETKIMIPDE